MPDRIRVLVVDDSAFARSVIIKKLESDPELEVVGPSSGRLLLLSWGGTYGACLSAAKECQSAGLSVAHVHLRHINPFPRNLGELISGYERVLIPELNLGQLAMLVRSRFLVDAEPVTKVQGRPFTSQELENKIHDTLRALEASS